MHFRDLGIRIIFYKILNRAINKDAGIHNVYYTYNSNSIVLSQSENGNILTQNIFCRNIIITLPPNLKCTCTLK